MDVMWLAREEKKEKERKKREKAVEEEVEEEAERQGEGRCSEKSLDISHKKASS